jgi:hypothetical protein
MASFQWRGECTIISLTVHLKSGLIIDKSVAFVVRGFIKGELLYQDMHENN